jgi:8-oxo-dGTP diphosphatase
MGEPSVGIEAVVAILTKNSRVLVIKRGPQAIFSGYWAPPSGRIEPGETQKEALVREIQEELGLNATATAKVWDCPTDDGDFLLHWWTAQTEAGELHLDPGEVADARWVTSHEFLALEPTFAGDRDFFVNVLPNLDTSSQAEGTARP